MTQNLFQLGKFTSAAGLILPWKIECDALTQGEWDCIAFVLATKLPAFGFVYGVPRGGVPLALAMEKYQTVTTERVLIVDDVWTTGKSLNKYAEACDFRDWVGAVAFARGVYPKHRITAFCEIL